jgi:hypothetical protein
MTSPALFYNLTEIEQLAVNLFYGWGYNFYRLENQLRADDQLVRAKAGWLLGRARTSISAAESAYRRERLPPPSREKPRPDPDAVAGAQAIEKLAHAVSSLAGQIAAQPVPEQDRMTQRYREEAQTLARLIAVDKRLVGQSELLRAMLDQRNGAWLLDNRATLEAGIAAIGETLAERQAILL